MNNLWIYLSILLTFISATIVILIKFLGQEKIDTMIPLSIAFILTGIVSLIYILYNKNYNKLINCKNYKKIVTLSFLLGFLFLFNYFVCIKTFNISPNIGYSHLIINMNVLITLIASVYLFRQKINLKTFIGIIVALLGTTIVIYNC